MITPKQTFLLWSVTLIVTFGSVVYQRKTGPTYPVRGQVEIGQSTVPFKLLRSHNSTGDAQMQLEVPDRTIEGSLRWRRYKSHDAWTTEPLVRNDDTLTFAIPKQPPAGKVMYQVTLRRSSQSVPLTPEPVVIRFKGPVPAWVLIPHILFMFVGMTLATRTALEALFGRKRVFTFSLWTTALLVLGGLILGPIVQKFAFDAFWTGWPFGHDLTDTKTAVAVLFWLVALWRCVKPGRGKIWVILAGLVTLAVYLIPHSVLGSELDYTKEPGIAAAAPQIQTP